MESAGKKPRRHCRAFTPEFKAEIVELCEGGTGASARSRGLRPDWDRGPRIREADPV